MQGHSWSMILSPLSVDRLLMNDDGLSLFAKREKLGLYDIGGLASQNLSRYFTTYSRKMFKQIERRLQVLFSKCRKNVELACVFRVLRQHVAKQLAQRLWNYLPRLRSRTRQSLSPRHTRPKLLRQSIRNECIGIELRLAFRSRQKFPDSIASYQ